MKTRYQPLTRASIGITTTCPWDQGQPGSFDPPAPGRRGESSQRAKARHPWAPLDQAKRPEEPQHPWPRYPNLAPFVWAWDKAMFWKWSSGPQECFSWSRTTYREGLSQQALKFPAQLPLRAFGGRGRGSKSVGLLRAPPLVNTRHKFLCKLLFGSRVVRVTRGFLPWHTFSWEGQP